jgi:hypothetical protein
MELGSDGGAAAFERCNRELEPIGRRRTGWISFLRVLVSAPVNLTHVE